MTFPPASLSIHRYLAAILGLLLAACGEEAGGGVDGGDGSGGGTGRSSMADSGLADDGHDHEHDFDVISGDAGATDETSTYDWKLPAGFPVPKVPEDNPMSVAKVELGRHLFYDTRLSGNETQSCGTCHLQELAFTDGKAVGLGSTGEAHIRGSMSLVNIAYATTLTWANPVVRTLERQALVPLFGEDPVELGLVSREDELIERVLDDSRYPGMFLEAFPERDGEVTVGTITKALAAFERSIVSGDSDFDHYVAGDKDALGPAASRGMELFLSERLECFHCHNGFYFSDSVTHARKAFDEVAFHNTGLYNIPAEGSHPGGYPVGNEGLWNFTADEDDIGRMKAPTLRNIALTAPYMHDGSIATLSEVIDHYAAGGRTITEGPNAGVGSRNRNRSEFVTGFEISDAEKQDLIAFLNALTDESLLTDPRFSNPWEDAD